MRALVIFPTYNERESLQNAIESTLEHNPHVEVLIVDDASPDGTGDLADQLSQNNSRVHVLHRLQKEGLGPAYLAGFEWGTGRGFDHLIEMDADGSHRPQDLPKLLQAAETVDLVIGSRWIAGGSVENWPWQRKLISKVGNAYSAMLLGSKIKDMTAGFRVYKTALISEITRGRVAAHGYAFQVEMAWRAESASAKIVEVPIVFVERVQGRSKMTSKIVLEALSLVTLWGIDRIFRGRRH